MPVVLGAASAFTTRRLVFYGMASTIAAFAIIINAFRQRPNFYSATVMLGGSNGCMMVLINFGIFLTLCFGKLCQKVFFGPLRAIEIEHLHERLWYAVTETLLAMTIFRDDFDSSFAILFGTLLFLKVFHWLSADRVEYMEQTPSVGRLFHVRMISVLSMLFEFDLFLATFAVEVLIIDKDRKGIMIMFANEFFILGATLWSTIAKYLINCQDMRSEEPWEAKSLYVFFVDLITDFLKLATYIACFCLILSFYGGLPLHIFRDVYVTGMSFFSRLRDFMKYRAATRNMDTRFPDATSAELRSMSDGTCIICREEMVARNAEAGEGEGESRGEGETQGQSNQPTPATPNNSGLNETPKKLPCGHIFHFYCLRSWLERQQSCPTCRRTVFATNAGDQQTQVQGQGGQGVGVAGMAPGAVAAAGNGQQNGAVNGNPPTQTQQNTGNANRSSRDQLQAFLQQIQNDAQRMRQEHLDRNQRGRGEEQNNQTPNQRVMRADNSDSVAGQNSEPIVDRNGNPTRTMLIKSLFNVKSTPSSSTRNRQEEGNPYVRRSNLPPAPSLSGLSAYNSLDRSGDPNDTYIPPPPWTLRSSRRSNLQPLAGSSKQTSPDNSKQNTGSEDEERKDTEKVNEDQPTKAKEQEKEEEKVDPVDAREAARAAALRRFQSHQGQSSVTPTTEIVSKATASSEKINDVPPPAESSSNTPQRLLPGNPHLIPLFDTSSVQGYTRNHAAQLPYPLIEHKQSQTAERVRTNSGLEDRLNSLNLQSLSLTDQEMSNLSKRTRQGLEERLRLLYRVEGAVSDLVEELTRALSALPGEDEILNDQSTNDIQDHHNLDVNDKGKAPIEGIHART